MISQMKMTQLQLGVGVKATILVSHLHPKDTITKAYPNYSKSNKVQGLVVLLEGPKPIHHEEKVVVVFWHPPKDQQAEEFDCWALHQFVHVTEEGDKSTFFDRLTGSGGNVEEVIKVAEFVTNNTSESTESEESNDNVLMETAELLESQAPTINNDDAWLVHSLSPGMVEDDNQPLPKNISTMAEQQDSNPPEFFGGWEHSGSCYQCLDSGRKNKAQFNFNHEVSQTIQKMFETFFQGVYCWNDCAGDMLTFASGQAMPHHILGVPALAGSMVPDGNHQWPRVLWILVSG